METNLQHEDLLIKLRAKLNEQKIKLWEPPYILPDNGITQSLQELAAGYSNDLSVDQETVVEALRELQLHSIDRSKANAEFKETGCATFRVRATMPGEKPRVMKVQRKLEILGSELIKAVADGIGVTDNRVKLIFNGKVINTTQTLHEQGVKNGAQIMALVMAETPEEVKKEDTMYMEMKTTRDDAMLLSECVDDFDDDDEYMKLEDQSGKAVQLPASERKALMVGLALHERGRAAAKNKEYSLALVLLLEADRHFSDCSSSILNTVDNWAVLQLDIAWSYLCLNSLSAASDAANRLARAESAFRNTYGEDHQRLIALKGTAANERVLFMRLYLLQGIVAYHQNKRAEARTLLEKAENEMSFLRVEDGAVAGLVELGWSPGQARAGLRAVRDPDGAHQYLVNATERRAEARRLHRENRQRRQLGLCLDGSEVKQQFVEALIGMGFSRRLATLALRNSNNHVSDAVRLIQEQPEMLVDSDVSSSDSTQSPRSDETVVEPDEKLILELSAMGYELEEAKTALKWSRNSLEAAVDLLVGGGGKVQAEDPANPSTSSGAAARKKHKKHRRDKKRKERQQALDRLSSAIKADEDDHLDTSLVEEEQFLAQYKSLL
ncbi:hypothetical protein evm_011801 [Chilo suppressalis]|nr:hypothetical protein evm_011801 [Chilo suppressalis]